MTMSGYLNHPSLSLSLSPSLSLSLSPSLRLCTILTYTSAWLALIERFRVFFKYQVFLHNLFPPDFLGILLWYFFVPRFVCFSFLLVVFLYRSISLGFVFVAYFCFLSCRIAFGCFLDAFCLAFVLYCFGHFILMFFLCQICR